jgi:hypothetical protein
MVELARRTHPEVSFDVGEMGALDVGHRTPIRFPGWMRFGSWICGLSRSSTAREVPVPRRDPAERFAGTTTWNTGRVVPR